MWNLWAGGISKLGQRESAIEFYRQARRPTSTVELLAQGNRELFLHISENKEPNDPELQIEAVRKTAKAALTTMSSALPSISYHGHSYGLDTQTAARWKTHTAKDVVFVYPGKHNSKNAPLALRLNLVQLGLADRGIFYKGGPTTDNRYRPITRGDTHDGWDQAAYPTSPLAYFETHMKQKS